MNSALQFLLTLLLTALLAHSAPAFPDVVMSSDASLTIHFQMGDASWAPSVTRTNTALFRSVGTASTSDLRVQGTGTSRTLRLRPAPGLYGESHITLTITGDPGGPSESTFKVTVVPRAVADNLLGISGKVSTFDVLRNDTNPQPGTQVSLQSFTQPANGSLVAGSVPGTLRYTPAQGFSGSDSFTYTALYHTGDTATAIGHISVQNHLPIEAKHTDIRMNYLDGVWSNEIHADLDFGTPNAGGSANPTILDFDEALLVANPSSIITLPTSLDPVAFSFLGKNPGEPIWSLPQSAKNGVLWPGISSESILSGTFAAYSPTGDPRATANAAWLRLEMTSYRIPEGAVFSMYQGDSGGPKVFWDSIDGVNSPSETSHGNNVSDTFWITVGSHAHMNWTFTQPGHYQIDCRSRAFINRGGNLVEVVSPVNTLHFMVYGNGDPSTITSLPETQPFLLNDLATVSANSPATLIDVLANDRSSPDLLEALTITSVTTAQHGSTAIVPGGIQYRPTAGFAGADHFTYTVTDEHGGSANASVQITILPQTLADWRLHHYGTSDNVGIAANDQDPDHDGIENLLEYAFQLDPTARSTHLLPQASLVGGALQLSFAPPTAVIGILWGAKWSPTLRNDDWHAIPNSGTPAEQLYQLPISGQERAFIRISVNES